MNYSNQDFVQLILKFLKEELDSKNIENRILECERIFFFASEMINNTLKILYNSNELIKLKQDAKIEKGIIKQTAIYFADHEYQHWIQKFQIFDSKEFKKFSDEEKKIITIDSYNGESYFVYNGNNLRYLFIDFLVDRSLDNSAKLERNLYIQYNLRKLKDLLNDLNIKYYKDIINDNTIKNYFLKKLKKDKILQKILERVLRLYGLNQLAQLEQIKKDIKEFDIEKLLQIFYNVASRLIELESKQYEITDVKEKFIEIKIFLESRDYLNILFSNT